MGWYFDYSHREKQDVVRYLTSPADMFPGARLLGYSLKGNTLWTAWDTTGCQYGDGHQGTKFIACHILAKERGGSWGYKPMDESMGPYYFDVPQYFFDLVPVPPSQSAAEWRQKVKEYQESEKVKKAFISSLKIGDDIVFPARATAPFELKIIQLKPKMVGIEPNGMRWRLIPSVLKTAKRKG